MILFSTFKQSIMQAKVDSLLGERLLDDTEKFFANNKKMRAMINNYNPSLNKNIKPSSKQRSSIY